MENRFNLIDEPWIPVANQGLRSLRDVFTHLEYRAMGGNPVEKIALMKLLLAIAQSAATPADEKEWRELREECFTQKCLAYLDKWHERFYLYGDKPFLQMPQLSKAKVQSFGAVLPYVSSGNTTVLNHHQLERSLDDAERALLLLTLMGFALSGKKTDNSVILSPGYTLKTNEKGRPGTGRTGPSVAYFGMLHNFLLGSTLIQSIWINVLSHEQVKQMAIYEQGIGVAPWEVMPAGEDCLAARKLKQSLIGRLIPMCRFCLLVEDGLHYSEGVFHAGYKEGMVDPSMAVNYSGKEPKALWTNPEKRPWRELTSLLGFVGQTTGHGFQSWQIRFALDRAREVTDTFSFWSGGLRVSSNAGEQYASGSDDYVESQIWLNGSALGELWFILLKHEMEGLDGAARQLYGRVMAFYKAIMAEGKSQAEQATNLFWQMCERDFQRLIDACESSDEALDARQKLRFRFSSYAHLSYDQFCPKETARQIDTWARCRPNFSQYLKQEGKVHE